MSTSVAKLAAQSPKKNKKSKLGEKLDLAAEAKELARNCGTLVKDIQTLNKATRDEDNTPPKLPDKFLYRGEPVTTAFPHDLRQHIYDLCFLKVILGGGRDTLPPQRDRVCRFLLLWRASAQLQNLVWARDKAHEFPDFKKYELVRAEMIAMYETSYRVEEKIHDYFDKNGRSALTARIEKLMKIGEQTKAERLEVHKRHCDMFFDHYQPVDELADHLDTEKSQLHDNIDITDDEWMTDFFASGTVPPE
ncbi:lipoyltransferase [Physcia stellaris]|nr:lipoyltransferase [Physcia stellaris]